MSQAERDEVLTDLTSRIFSAMLEDMVTDIALQSHHEIARNRAVCHVCQTRCGSVHNAGPSNLAPQGVVQPSRPVSPSSEVKVNGSIDTDTSTPPNVKAEAANGNMYFECLNCKRQIASNRYAPHLSACMGLGTGSRRGASRSANAKSKQSSEAGRSASPYFGSDNGNASDDSQQGKKGKSKSKRADEAEFNLKRKRPASPQVSPNKKQKKQKASGSPVSRVKADPDGGSTATHHFQLAGTHSKVPSKLRANSTASFIERSSSPDSRSSTPGTPIASISTPTSTLSAQSPSLTNGMGRGRKKNGSIINGGPLKRPSPPRPPPPPVRVPEPDYLIDVDGEETGSSTDTDSS